MKLITCNTYVDTTTEQQRDLGVVSNYVKVRTSFFADSIESFRETITDEEPSELTSLVNFVSGDFMIIDVPYDQLFEILIKDEPTDNTKVSN